MQDLYHQQYVSPDGSEVPWPASAPQALKPTCMAAAVSDHGDCSNLPLEMALHWDQTPQRQGLYDPTYESDACGVGAVMDMGNLVGHWDIPKLSFHGARFGECFSEA